jgi:hypothetical protein
VVGIPAAILLYALLSKPANIKMKMKLFTPA